MCVYETAPDGVASVGPHGNRKICLTLIGIYLSVKCQCQQKFIAGGNEWSPAACVQGFIYIHIQVSIIETSQTCKTNMRAMLQCVVWLFCLWGMLPLWLIICLLKLAIIVELHMDTCTYRGDNRAWGLLSLPGILLWDFYGSKDGSVRLSNNFLMI